MSKESMTATIVAGAKKLGARVETADGSARVSGHSLRMTGAQGFARWGLDSWAIQLLGRWGSSAVLEYIQEVPLELSTAWAKRGGPPTRPEPTCTSTSASSSSGLGGPLTSSTSTDLPVKSQEALSSLAAERTTEAEAAPAQTESKVVLSPGRIWHRVPPAGMVGPMSGWSTVCGWRFSASEAVVQDALPAPLLHKQMCKRCFPAERSAAKEAL